MNLTGILSLWPPFRVGEYVAPVPAGDFLSALRARLLATPSLAALSDVYLTTSPPGATMPYLVVSRLYQTPAVNTSDAYIKEVGMQFTILSLDASEADTLSAAAFDALLHREANPPIVFDEGYEMARFPGQARGPDADCARCDRGGFGVEKFF